MFLLISLIAFANGGPRDAGNLSALRPPTLFEQRSLWVQESLVRFRITDDTDVRTFGNTDALSRATLRSYGSQGAPVYSVMGIGLFATLTVLIAHGPAGVRDAITGTFRVGPASLSDGAMGGAWGIHF